MEFCVYLTTYFGNKLPMFYIGSSRVSKVNGGYRGSVSSKVYKDIWKSELIKNPHLFKTKIISLHADDKLARRKELLLQEKLNVIKSPLYINRSKAKVNGFFGSVLPAHNKNLCAWTDGVNMMYSSCCPGADWVRGTSPDSKLKKSAAKRKSGKEHHNFGRIRSNKTNKKFVKAISKKYKITDPNGKVFVIQGLNQFCKSVGINVTGAHRVLSGVQTMYKNYIFEKI